MDVKMNYAAVEETISQFQRGIEGLDQTLQTLERIIQNYEGGSFLGECADAYIELMRRKMDLTRKLRDTYSNAIAKLQKAMQTMQETDRNLHSRVASI